MRERPILFSGAMVRAILDGTKTQTRRVIKPQPGAEVNRYEPGFVNEAWQSGFIDVRCPYGNHDDRLRVKEAAWMYCERRPNGTTPTGRPKWIYEPLRSAEVRYVADRPQRPTIDVVHPETGNQWGWRYKVARFMPAWASRITLEVIDVRVERLQEISDDDARAEGVAPAPFCKSGRPPGLEHVEAFESLWESINGARPGCSWADNPWLWVVEFRCVEAETRAA